MTNTTEATETEALSRIRAWRGLRALSLAPELIHHLRSSLEPADGRSERSEDFPTMSTPLLTGIADDADSVYAQVLDWVSYWSRLMEFTPNAAAVVAWRAGSTVGFRAGTTPTGAAALTRIQTIWLQLRDDQIVRHPSAGTYYDDISTLIDSLRAKYRLTDERQPLVSPRPCPNCAELAVHATWLSEDPTEVQIECEVCGHHIDRPKASQILKWLS